MGRLNPDDLNKIYSILLRLVANQLNLQLCSGFRTFQGR